MKARFWIAAGLIAAAACTGKYVRPTTDEKVEATPERLARGQYLVDYVASCGACHTARPGGDMALPESAEGYLAGGNWLADGELGVWVPNITNDPETGIGSWSDDELIRAIRDGVRPDGTFMLPLMPFGSYRHMSDEDVRAVVAYLRSAPRARPATPRRAPQVPWMTDLALGMGFAMHEPAQGVAAPDRSDPVKYGAYLAHLGHCNDCHSMTSMGPRQPGDEYMAGGDVPMDLPGVGKVWARNLTPDPETGLGSFDEAEIKRALQSGMRLDGRPMAPPMSIFVPHLAMMEDADLDALVAFLRSLPPVRREVPERELAPEAAEIFGN